ncbi:MAG TPA: protein kinase [Terracidiphilus sp.]|nr:protein kinase [Terracidiphilus sp.]
MTAVLIRGSLVGQVIDGRFSLLEWLGGSGTSGTFLTELSGPGSQKAAIKLFSTPAQAEDRLSTWTETTSFSHVHLVRILHFGRAEIDGAPVVYVVTEFAEEVLSQIIPERPLAADEAREMIVPVLDALSYLHAKNYAHAHLRPSNILVVENEVKLSADSILAEDRLALELESGDLHNAPETATNPIAPSADIWSLGVTLVEALTQQLPVWDSAGDGDPVLPASLPKPFAAIVHQCLRIDPERRCTLREIRVMLAGKSDPVSPLPPPQELPKRNTPTQSAAKSSSARIPMIPLIVGLLLLVAIIVGLLLRSHKTNTDPLETETTRQAPPAKPDPQPPAPTTATAGPQKGEVLHRVVPDVPQTASNTIHGKIAVAVRVSVDPTGAVTNAEFVVHGSSAYFARLAMESAHDWKFKAPQQNGHAVASSWLLHYEFKRSGTDVTPVETSP